MAPMARVPIPFKRTDINRLVDAARRNNLPVAMIEVEGRIVRLIIGDPASGSKTNGEADGNPWDEVLTNAADQKRAS
jgi:hypothetical protein